MSKYSAAITVEFEAEDAAEAEKTQQYFADVMRIHGVVFADTIGPPECIEECCESEEG